MKTVIYAVKTKTGWEAFFSVSWEVDEHYWLAKQSGTKIVRLKESLPLGLAEAVCDRLNQRWKKKRATELTMGTVKEELIATVCALGQSDDLEPGGTEEVDKADTSEWGKTDEIAKAAQSAGSLFAGRSLLREEVLQLMQAVFPAFGGADCLAALQLAALTGKVRLSAAVSPRPAAVASRGLGELWRRAHRRHRKPELQCRRCGSSGNLLRRTPCAACGQACAYCEACLTMGRSRECELLVVGAPPAEGGAQAGADAFPAAPASLEQRWGLSPAQGEAASKALQFLRRQRRDPAPDAAFLLWAVTGAGKTEMIFPLLEDVLANGGRALVATPRRDVVLELAPRLAKAFPDYSLTVLYGGSPDRWGNGALTLATTHQLMRFQEAFDLALIDELDAFPYHNDPMLQYAAAKCRKPEGATVFLSATPPLAMQRAAARRRLPCAKVPVRYHRHPLPVPQMLTIPPISRWLGKAALPQRLAKPLQQSVGRGAQVFVFVPYIRQVTPLVRLLRQQSAALGVPESRIEGTSSQDAQRADKVSAFRSQSIRMLVTTTILERGVTIPKSDVFVLDADNPLFDAAALVQMAGRAGRSAADPDGFVYFTSASLNASQQSAVNQIRGMNRIAKKNGYLR